MCNQCNIAIVNLWKKRYRVWQNIFFIVRKCHIYNYIHLYSILLVPLGKADKLAVVLSCLTISQKCSRHQCIATWMQWDEKEGTIGLRVQQQKHDKHSQACWRIEKENLGILCKEKDIISSPICNEIQYIIHTIYTHNTKYRHATHNSFMYIQHTHFTHFTQTNYTHT